MKLLVFEYSSVILDNNLLSEGFNMLKSMLDDLNKINIFDVYYLINSSMHLDYEHLTPIYIKENFTEWLNENISSFDYAFFVAPEEDLIQYNITKILEENDVTVLGCDSNASYICSSKDLTYKKIPDNILKIKSIKVNTDYAKYEIIPENINKNTCIIKPDDKTSSDFIYLCHNREEFDKIIKIYKKNSIKKVLIQEFIDGIPISASILCKEDYVKCISINLQQIKIDNDKLEFVGCESPIQHPQKNKIETISKKIIHSIPGLNAFVGIDYIIQDDKIFFVEINSRITTPYIILQKNCNQNLTENIINLLIHDKIEEINFKKSGKFIK